MSPPAAPGAPHPSLARHMRLAYLGEVGAGAIYGRLARRVRDPELAELLRRFRAEEERQQVVLRGLLDRLGAGRVHGVKRRRLLALGLAQVARLGGLRLVLRICQNAEQTIARWYGEYAAFLLRAERPEEARVCEELRLTKERHAQALGAWILLA